MPLLAVGLLGGGGAYFASEVDPSLARLRTFALVAMAAVLLVHLVRHADPAWLISGGIAASMFSGQWGQLGIHSSIVPERVLLLVGVGAVLLRLGKARERPPIELGRVHFALATALAYAAVSMVISNTMHNHAATFGLLDQFGAIPFLVFTVAPVVFRTQRQRNILLWSLVLTGAYLGLTALFEKLKITALIVPSYISDPAVGIHFGRARGPFVEAVPDGLALYACAIAALAGFVLWDKRWQRAFALAVAALAAVGVVVDRDARGLARCRRGEHLRPGGRTAVAEAPDSGGGRWTVSGAGSLRGDSGACEPGLESP